MKTAKPTQEDAFQALLAGERSEASPQVEALAKLATALRPEQHKGPSPQFKARLRNTLLAQASTTEEEQFAMALEISETAPQEMRALVAVASALQPSSLPTVSPQFRYQLRNRLIAEASHGTSIADRARARALALNERMQRSLRAIVATGIVAALVGGSGAAVAASANALPVDTLYGVKRLHESAQLLFTSGNEKGFKILDHARTRLTEVRGMTRRPVHEQKPYISTLKDMDAQTIEGETIIVDQFQKHHGARETLQRVDAFARVQMQDLQGLVSAVPAGALPAIRDSMTVAALVVRRVDNVIAGCATTCPANALSPGTGTSSNGTSNQAAGCSCSTSFSSGSDQGSNGSSDGNSGGNPGPNPGPSPSPEPSKPPKKVDLAPLPGGADQTIEDAINALLNQLPPLPVPVPTVPPLPVPTPTVPPLPIPTSLSQLPTGF